MNKVSFNDLRTQYLKIRDNIELAISKVYEHGLYINGPEVHELEKKLSSYTGSKYCISVANGTDALEIAQKAINIKAGDEIILPAYTWISTAETVKYIGANPVYCDVDGDTFCVDVQDIYSKITQRTKAIVAVSLFGQCADLIDLKKFCDSEGIYLIEDAAQSFGAMHLNQKSCSIAHISTTSFFPSKPLGCFGDGGAIFTDDDELAKRIRLLARHGQLEKDNFVIVGRNSRLDTIQAAILLEKLKIFDQEIKLRNDVHHSYKKFIDSDIYTCPVIKDYNKSVFAQYTLKASENVIKNAQKQLSKNNIPSTTYYKRPIHLQEAYRTNEVIELPTTDSLATKTISLPMSPYISKEIIEEIATIINQI